MARVTRFGGPNGRAFDRATGDPEQDPEHQNMTATGRKEGITPFGPHSGPSWTTDSSPDESFSSSLKRPRLRKNGDRVSDTSPPRLWEGV